MTDEQKLRGELADLQHQQWSGWMQWMLEAKAHELSGDIVIPGGLYDRWKRQLHTPYVDLPEDEKESDRIEADKYLPIIARERASGVNDVLTLATDKPSQEALRMLREWKAAGRAEGIRELQKEVKKVQIMNPAILDRIANQLIEKE